MGEWGVEWGMERNRLLGIIYVGNIVTMQKFT